MSGKKFSIVIRVRKLERSRIFYRDMLGLGQPALDSNFWVEFSLSEDSALRLERMEENDPEPLAGNQAGWTCYVPSISAFLEKLENQGYSTEGSYPCDKFGYRMYAVKDPDGNLFYITDNTPIK